MATGLLKKPRKTVNLHVEALESRLNLSTMSGLLTPAAALALNPVQIVGAPVGSAAPPAATPQAGAATTTTVPVLSYSAIYNCQPEIQSGQTQSDIGYVSTSGAYIEYTVTAPSTGNYQLNLGLASADGGSLQVLVNGNAQATIATPAGHSWRIFVNGSATIQMNAGTNVLRFAAQNGTQYNIKTISYTAAAAPAAPVGTTIGNDTPVDVTTYSNIYNSRLEYLKSGPDIGYVSASGAYVEYTVNVQTAGIYTLNAGVAAVTQASFDVASNGATLASFTTSATGAWSSFSTVSQSISLGAGQQVLRFTATHGTQYNLGTIELVRDTGSATTSLATSTPTPTPTPAPTPPPPPPPLLADVSVTSRWMTSFTEIDVVGTTGNDSILVTQSGGTLTITGNGHAHQISANGELVVLGGDGNDTITINSSVVLDARIYGGDGNNTLDNFTQGQATIVSIGGGVDKLVGNGINTSFWADSSDNVVATAAEISNGGVHVVSAFIQPYTTNPAAGGYVPLQLDGQNLVDPTAGGNGTTRLSDSSFFGLGPVQTDINQGQSNDCYFLTAMQSLARAQPQTLRQLGVDLGDGTYAIAFKRGGVTQYLRVDGDLPTSNGQILYNHVGSTGNQWASIFEKAYAYLRTGQNSYASLDYGFMTGVYTDFGVNATTFSLPSEQNGFYAMASAKLSSGQVVDVCTNPRILLGAPLVASHTYSVVNTWRDSSGTVWVTLRNPWGFDGFSVDANPWDGMLTMTYSMLLANVTSGSATA